MVQTRIVKNPNFSDFRLGRTERLGPGVVRLSLLRVYVVVFRILLGNRQYLIRTKGLRGGFPNAGNIVRYDKYLQVQRHKVKRTMLRNG